MRIKRLISLLAAIILLLTSYKFVETKEKDSSILNINVRDDKAAPSLSEKPSDFFSRINGCWYDIDYNQFICFAQSTSKNENSPFHTNVYTGMMNSDVIAQGYVKELDVYEKDEIARVLLYFDKENIDEQYYHDDFELAIILDYTSVSSSNILQAYYEDSKNKDIQGSVLSLEHYGPYSEETMKAMSKAQLESAKQH